MDKNKKTMIIGVIVTIISSMILVTATANLYISLNLGFDINKNEYYNYIFFSIIIMILGLSITFFGNHKWKKNILEIKNKNKLFKNKIKKWKNEGYNVNELESMIEKMKNKF
jgi:hypothetical protein